ncbi:hypothetical protein DH2020_036689 [Rehmannia glutinosa]|uniref:Uncharacterized protein n=1 Tax=Rehmannia glutinosa TaxID=99300 RepID=A0ABR0V473_REHGL
MATDSTPPEYPTQSGPYANVIASSSHQSNSPLIPRESLQLALTMKKMERRYASSSGLPTKISISIIYGTGLCRIELIKERIEELVLEFDDTSHTQKIIYERIRTIIKKKAPRESGLVSKEFLKSAKKSKHTYFDVNHSNAEGSSTNRFSSLENDVFQPLDTLSQLTKGSDHINDLHLDDQVDTITVEKKRAGDVVVAVAVAKNEVMAGSRNPINLGDNSCLKDPTFQANMECQLAPPSLNSRMVHSSDRPSSLNFRIRDGAAGVPLEDICGARSQNIPTDLSIPSTPLEDFNDQFDKIGILHGPTTIPFHGKKVADDHHTLIFDKSNKIGSIPLHNSRWAPIKDVGHDVFLSPILATKVGDDYNFINGPNSLPPHHHVQRPLMG